MKKYKLYIGVLLIFMLGVITGAIGSVIIVRHKIKHFIKSPPHKRQAMLLKKLDRELDLTKKQKQSFKKIIQETAKQVKELHMKHHPVFIKIIGTGIEKMKKELDTKQKIKLEEMHKKLMKIVEIK